MEKFEREVDDVRQRRRRLLGRREESAAHCAQDLDVASEPAHCGSGHVRESVAHKYPGSKSKLKGPARVADEPCLVMHNQPHKICEAWTCAAPVSRDGDRGTTPSTLTAPWVVRIPGIPQKAAGTRTLPAVSVPRAKSTSPAATADADPEL